MSTINPFIADHYQFTKQANEPGFLQQTANRLQDAWGVARAVSRNPITLAKDVITGATREGAAGNRLGQAAGHAVLGSSAFQDIERMSQGAAANILRGNIQNQFATDFNQLKGVDRLKFMLQSILGRVFNIESFKTPRAQMLRQSAGRVLSRQLGRADFSNEELDQYLGGTNAWTSDPSKHLQTLLQDRESPVYQLTQPLRQSQSDVTQTALKQYMDQNNTDYTGLRKNWDEHAPKFNAHLTNTLNNPSTYQNTQPAYTTGGMPQMQPISGVSGALLNPFVHAGVNYAPSN